MKRTLAVMVLASLILNSVQANQAIYILQPDAGFEPGFRLAVNYDSEFSLDRVISVGLFGPLGVSNTPGLPALFTVSFPDGDPAHLILIGSGEIPGIGTITLGELNPADQTWTVSVNGNVINEGTGHWSTPDAGSTCGLLLSSLCGLVALKRKC